LILNPSHQKQQENFPNKIRKSQTSQKQDENEEENLFSRIFVVLVKYYLGFKKPKIDGKWVIKKQSTQYFALF
jgi:hypothetical protein